jgi:hypothetical protein
MGYTQALNLIKPCELLYLRPGARRSDQGREQERLSHKQVTRSDNQATQRRKQAMQRHKQAMQSLVVPTLKRNHPPLRPKRARLTLSSAPLKAIYPRLERKPLAKSSTQPRNS